MRAPGLVVTFTSAALGACLDTEPIDLGEASRADTTSAATDTRDALGAADTSDADTGALEIVDPRPCLHLTPELTDFGGTLLGTSKHATIQATNCGAAPIDITDVTLGLDAAPRFSADVDDPPPLAPGASLVIEVTYTPVTLAPLDADGAPIHDTATLRVITGATSFHAGIRGFGVADACPVPVITRDDEMGDEVTSGTRLHLSGASSIGVGAPIVAWHWSVQQPAGSNALFLPTSTTMAPSFTVGVTGTYTFRLDVVDASGVTSCAPAELTVDVASPVALRVELTWRTIEGGAPDDTADLDLHFLHPFATSADGTGYFDTTFDVFWFNENPNWGVFASTEDDPVLLIDATDDPGPEVLELRAPEPDARYCVGVHFWMPRGARALATVRVLVLGELAFEARDASLVRWDRWDVACLTWPGGVIEDLALPDGQPRITPEYTSGFIAPD